MASPMFGEMFKKLRLDKGYSLRQFCREFGEDPANISRMERGLLAPPTSTDRLKSFASILGLSEGSEQWDDFITTAKVSAGSIPDEIMSNEQVLQKVPLLLRTISGSKLDDEKLDNLIEMIKRT